MSYHIKQSYKIKNVKELSIKNQTYYFFNDMINVKNFHSNLLKIDKKPYRDIDIYYIGYITIEKIGDYENIHSVNPLYLVIHSATGYFKDGKKYLVIDMTKKYEEVFSGIRSEIKMLNGGKEQFYGKNYVKVRVNTDNNILLNKKLKFPSLAIIIRCVFEESGRLYPQIYLDECLYEL